MLLHGPAALDLLDGTTYCRSRNHVKTSSVAQHLIRATRCHIVEIDWFKMILLDKCILNINVCKGSNTVTLL